MKANFGPGWLVNLLTRWAGQELRIESRSMGYPTRAPGFSEKITGGYDHSDPFDFHAQDFSALTEAVGELRDAHAGRCAALLMHYRPWCARALAGEGWPMGNSTYFSRLHAAHAWLASKMDEKNPRKVLQAA